MQIGDEVKLRDGLELRGIVVDVLHGTQDGRDVVVQMRCSSAGCGVAYRASALEVFYGPHEHEDIRTREANRRVRDYQRTVDMTGMVGWPELDLLDLYRPLGEWVITVLCDEPEAGHTDTETR